MYDTLVDVFLRSLLKINSKFDMTSYLFVQLPPLNHNRLEKVRKWKPNLQIARPMERQR